MGTLCPVVTHMNRVPSIEVSRVITVLNMNFKAVPYALEDACSCLQLPPSSWQKVMSNTWQHCD